MGQITMKSIRDDEPKKGVCPSVMTRKYRQIGRAIMNSTEDLMDLKSGYALV